MWVVNNKMWNHVIFFQKFFQSCRPIKIKFNKSKGFYQSHSRYERLVSNFLDSNLLLLCLGGFIGFKRFLSEEPDQSDRQAVKKYVLGGVLQLFYLGCHVAVMTVIWTIRNRCTETIWLLNQGYRLSQKRELNQITPKKKVPLDITMKFTILMWSNVIAVILAILTLSLTPILFNATPAHVLLSFFVDTHEQNWKITLTCMLYMIIFYSMGAFFNIAAMLVHTCAILYATPFLLTKIVDYSKKRRPFEAEQQCYRTAYLFIQNFNKFGICFFGALMMTAFLINVSMTFCAIKYHSSLSPYLVGVFVVFDVCVLGCTLGLHTFATIILEASAAFREYWKKYVKSKVQSKQLLTCRPISLRIGIFFNLERQVVVRTVDQIVNQTVNVLIMDS